VASWLSAWLASESGFVERVTSQLPPTPPNFVRIVELNESGDVPGIDPADLEAGAKPLCREVSRWLPAAQRSHAWRTNSSTTRKRPKN
jgi:hypothetical protein